MCEIIILLLLRRQVKEVGNSNKNRTSDQISSVDNFVVVYC